MARRLFVLVTIAALVTAVLAAGAGADSGDKALGGGQIYVGGTGAGDTIAFSAVERDSGVTGQVQYVDRTDGTGRGQIIYHGTVLCLEVAYRTAVLAGVWNHNAGNFEIYVVDYGEPNQGNDQIFVNENTTNPDCEGGERYEESATALARGNAQVFDN